MKIEDRVQFGIIQMAVNSRQSLSLRTEKLVRDLSCPFRRLAKVRYQRWGDQSLKNAVPLFSVTIDVALFSEK